MQRTRCSSAGSVGNRTASRSGTIAASSTARCGTTGRIRDPAFASPSPATVQSDQVTSPVRLARMLSRQPHGRAYCNVRCDGINWEINSSAVRHNRAQPQLSGTMAIPVGGCIARSQGVSCPPTSCLPGYADRATVPAPVRGATDAQPGRQETGGQEIMNCPPPGAHIAFPPGPAMTERDRSASTRPALQQR
jgi:hypothetical protein